MPDNLFLSAGGACAICAGTGRIILNPCPTCRGSGHVREENELWVNIPGGVEDGTRMRFQGEGDAVRDTEKRGDLYIFLSIEEHHLFRREGTDLFCAVSISAETAVQGSQVEVPTIDGNRDFINVPPDVTTGDRIQMPGKGMTTLGSSVRGDMYVDITVESGARDENS